MKSFFALFLLGMVYLCAEPLPENFDLDFKLGFLEGDYVLIGRKPGSKEPFTGTVTLRRNKDRLDVTRAVDGKTTRRVAFFEAVTPDQIVVLQMQFAGASDHLSGTYMCNPDQDNYVRMTGYVYDKSGDTKSPGLEVLFPAASLSEGSLEAE